MTQPFWTSSNRFTLTAVSTDTVWTKRPTFYVDELSYAGELASGVDAATSLHTCTGFRG